MCYTGCKTVNVEVELSDILDGIKISDIIECLNLDEVVDYIIEQDYSQIYSQIEQCIIAEPVAAMQTILNGIKDGAVSGSDIKNFKDYFTTYDHDCTTGSDNEQSLEKIGLYTFKSASEDFAPKVEASVDSIMMDVDSLSEDDTDLLMLKLLKKMRTPNVVENV